MSLKFKDYDAIIAAALHSTFSWSIFTDNINPTRDGESSENVTGWKKTLL